MQFKHFLGIDVSKKTIDLAIRLNQNQANMVNSRFANNHTGYQKMVTWIEQQGLDFKHTLICLENTGIYHKSLVNFLQSQNAFVWVENPIEIKRSMGIQRGKNDVVDAQRICLYAFRHKDKAKIYTNMDLALQELADLLAARERLINAKKAISLPIQELRSVGLELEADRLEKACSQTLSSLDKDLEGIEKQLKTIVEQEQKLQETCQSVISVPGVGFITALSLMVYTHNFERFDSAKKLASYSGVVPFTYSSGTSVRGRNKVHPMANKALKKVLHMCALSAIRFNQEIKTYYERKVEEGKNKMSVLNAIRNKLLHRIYACVRDNRMFEYKQAA